MTVHFPDPDERPGTDVVIWDGDCNLCRRQVERLSKFDAAGRLSYLSLHDQRVSQICPELTYDQMMEQMWVVARDGTKFGGADAVRYLSTRLPRLWWLAPAMYFPLAMPLWRWMYKQVAARRYRIAGKQCDGGTCHLHDVKQKSQPHS